MRHSERLIRLFQRTNQSASRPLVLSSALQACSPQLRLSSTLRQSSTISVSALRTARWTSSTITQRPAPGALMRSRQTHQARNSSTNATPSASAPANISATTPESLTSEPRAPREEYQLTFTCKECSHRSTHKVSKQAYHEGTSLAQCPQCKVRHLISDHLGIFSDKRVTLEDIMKDKGESIKKGRADWKIAVGDQGDGVVEIERGADSSAEGSR